MSMLLSLNADGYLVTSCVASGSVIDGILTVWGQLARQGRLDYRGLRGNLACQGGLGYRDRRGRKDRQNLSL